MSNVISDMRARLSDILDVHALLCNRYLMLTVA